MFDLTHRQLIGSVFLAAVSLGASANDTRTGTQSAGPSASDSATSYNASAVLSNQVATCLDTISRDCALTVALRVTAAGDLSIERAKVLFAVAETLHQLGDKERARLTTNLAKEEADSIGISIGTENSYVEIARLQAEIGDLQAAQETIDAIGDRYLKAHATGKAAVGLARNNRFDDAVELMSTVQVPLIGLRYTLDVIETLGNTASAESIAAVEKLVAAQTDPESNRMMRFIADARIAGARARIGDQAKAEEMRSDLVNRAREFSSFSSRARSLIALGRLDTVLYGKQADNPNLDRGQLLAGRVNVDYDRDIVLRELVIALALADRFDAAVQALNQFSSVEAKAETLDGLARLIGDQKNAEGVTVIQNVVRDSLDALADEESRIARDKVRVNMALALTHVGAVETAVDTISAIEDKEEQARAMAILARAL